MNAMKLAALVLLSAFTQNARAATSAEGAFTQLKSLAGTWNLVGQKENLVVYEVHSNGHSLVETFEGMVTVFHLDGDSILMTHYCSAGNQPRTRATHFNQPLSSLTFDFVDISNLKPGAHYITGLHLEWLSNGNLRQVWTSKGHDGGNEQSIFELERQKN